MVNIEPLLPTTQTNTGHFGGSSRDTHTSAITNPVGVLDDHSFSSTLILKRGVGFLSVAGLTAAGP